MKSRTTSVSYAILMGILQERTLKETFTPSGGKNSIVYFIFDHFDKL